MELDDIWNVVLTALIGVVGFVLRGFTSEQQRIQILLNRTREEMAKEYITKEEVQLDMNRIIDRLERLDEKLDRLVAR